MNTTRPSGRDLIGSTWRHIAGFGLIVQPMTTLDGLRIVYAEVEPAYSPWRPLPGRTSRWWYEVHAKHPCDEHGCDTTTYGYVEGGSGGGFTLAACVRRAQEAVNRFVEEYDAQQ